MEARSEWATHPHPLQGLCDPGPVQSLWAPLGVHALPGAQGEPSENNIDEVSIPMGLTFWWGEMDHGAGISHIQSVSEDEKCAKKKIRERDGEGWGGCPVTCGRAGG